jgi:signal transduction histidine kinase
MESIGRLAGGVAHDFNNMLGVILGYAEMTLDQVEAGTSIHSALQEIQQAARRSANLTRQLLADILDRHYLELEKRIFRSTEEAARVPVRTIVCFKSAIRVSM